MQVKIKLEPGAKAPMYADSGSAGADIFLYDEKVVIQCGDTYMCRTGIRMEIPSGYVGLIFARSGLATKCGLAPANCVGIIDSSFRGEVIVPLHNHSREHRILHAGDRIAQLIIMPYPKIQFEEVDDLSPTSRGEGGFGSTGGYSK